jgi:transposase
MRKQIDFDLLNKEVQKLSDQGLNITEISKKLGYSRSTIYKVIDKSYLTDRASKLKDKIFNYYKKGLNQVEIAKLCDVSKQYVHEVLRNLR